MGTERRISLAELEREVSEQYAQGVKDGRDLGPLMFDSAALEAAAEQIPELVGDSMRTLGCRMDIAGSVIATYFAYLASLGGK